MRYLALVVLIGCGGGASNSTPSGEGSAVRFEPATTEPGTTEPGSTEPGSTEPGVAVAPSHEPTPTATGGPDIVIARVLSSGPIGSGRCSQCSHELVVEGHVSGTIMPSATPFWAHFEWCAGDPEPQPSVVAPCSLEVGRRYELVLATGTSTNFPGERMVLSARPR